MNQSMLKFLCQNRNFAIVTGHWKHKSNSEQPHFILICTRDNLSGLQKDISVVIIYRIHKMSKFIELIRSTYAQAV